MLSLTKSQMDVLNRFLKSVLIFVDPKSCSFARKMHAGYMSCLRHSIRHVRRSDLAVRSCFDSCLYFSFALDSALFGQEHVLACTVRFTFNDRLEQFPLFMKVCGASTGEEVAAFVFDSLKVYNAQFKKLSSIATDGASAMIGQANGMISHFKRLVATELGTVGCPFNHVWCLAHRLNLVIRDFQNVPNINSVFSSLIGLHQRERQLSIGNG